jgi:hypothetical protein
MTIQSFKKICVSPFHATLIVTARTKYDLNPAVKKWALKRHFDSARNSRPKTNFVDMFFERGAIS